MSGTDEHDGRQEPSEDSVVSGDVVHTVGSGVGSGEQDYVATNAGGISAEDGNPLPEDEQGRGSEYDPETQGPQREG
jgi:hypothetical protein